MTDSITRVARYLDGRARMPHLDQEEIHGVGVLREDEPRMLTVADVTDLLRRAVLCDSLAAEIDRMGEIIAVQRDLIDGYNTLHRPECVALSQAERVRAEMVKPHIKKLLED